MIYGPGRWPVCRSFLKKDKSLFCRFTIQNALQGGEELVHVDGFAQMAVHAGGKDPLAVLLKGVGEIGRASCRERV